MLTTTFLRKVCATYQPVSFINLIFLRCTVPFSKKELCALSLIPSFIVLLLKGCLGLLQYLLHCLCGRFIDFQPFGFYGSLGHASGFLRLFFSLLPTSLIISRAIHAHFSENAQFCFLSASLTSFPCSWILFHGGCHLYAIYVIATEHLL